jgi:hypothetical protein
MRIADFENAVEAKGNIDIDEVKVNHGQVRQCYGHTETVLILWDQFGRAFSVGRKQGIDISECQVSEKEYERDSRFDLTFV